MRWRNKKMIEKKHQKPKKNKRQQRRRVTTTTKTARTTLATNNYHYDYASCATCKFLLAPEVWQVGKGRLAGCMTILTTWTRYQTPGDEGMGMGATLCRVGAAGYFLFTLAPVSAPTLTSQALCLPIRGFQPRALPPPCCILRNDGQTRLPNLICVQLSVVGRVSVGTHFEE